MNSHQSKSDRSIRPPKPEITLKAAQAFSKYLYKLRSSTPEVPEGKVPGVYNKIVHRVESPKSRKSSPEEVEVLHYLKVEDCAKCEAIPINEKTISKLKKQCKKLKTDLKERDIEIRELRVFVKEKDTEINELKRMYKKNTEQLVKKYKNIIRNNKEDFGGKLRESSFKFDSQKFELMRKIDFLEKSISESSPFTVSKLCNDLLLDFKDLETAFLNQFEAIQSLTKKLEFFHMETLNYNTQIAQNLIKLESFIRPRLEDLALNELLFSESTAQSVPHFPDPTSGFKQILIIISRIHTLLQDKYAEFCGSCPVQ